MSSSPSTSLPTNTIGECLICLSSLKSSNIFAISKCGHTFHQNCIIKWIKSAKSCPSCRAKAAENDVIKLFIQEYHGDVKEDVAGIQKKLQPFTETRSPDYLHRLMSECKCELVRFNNGNIKHICNRDYNVEIQYMKNDRQITVIYRSFFSGYIIRIFLSKDLEIIREKSNEKSYVSSNGIRFEYYFQGNVKKTFVAQREDKSTKRSDNDYVEQDENYIKFYCPGFTVIRNLKKEYAGRVVIHAFSNNREKYLKIAVCPEHETFYVKHFHGSEEILCTMSESMCEHLEI